VSWGIDLASEHERYLTEEVFCQPVIVYDYPKEIKVVSFCPPYTSIMRTIPCVSLQRRLLPALHRVGIAPRTSRWLLPE